ncbi:MAG: NAD(+)/NADH kinase [Vicinamibacterales bacterium]
MSTHPPVIACVGVVAKDRLHAATPVLGELRAWLETRGVRVLYSKETAELAGTDGVPRSEIPRTADLVIALGGDGTLLSMAGRIAASGRDVPLVGVNFGSLGFLTEVRVAELFPTLEAVFAGTAVEDSRLLLEATAERAGHPPDTRLVLNDVVFAKASLSRMIELTVEVSGVFVTRVKADGLIIASPTGSTAYNLAAGGPIVHPVVDALVVTPIAPHTLTNRPIVVPASSTVDVYPLASHGEDTLVTYDGQSGYVLRAGDRVRVSRAGSRVRLLTVGSRSYYDVLREKLKWGER